jgi:hypothetical protein
MIIIGTWRLVGAAAFEADAIAVIWLPAFENKDRRLNILVEGICRARKAALGVRAIVEFHCDVEHHKICGRHTAA